MSQLRNGLFVASALIIVIGASSSADAQRLAAQTSISKENIQMTRLENSTAISVARSHIEAWSNHDFGKARTSLASDVKVHIMTTQPIMHDVNTTGIDAYMSGLETFAQGVVPGSAKVLSAVGDEHNALILVTVRAKFGPDAPEITLPAARLYLIDDDKKIKSEQVVFYAAEH